MRADGSADGLSGDRALVRTGNAIRAAEAGFTLIELLVVLSLAALLLAVAAPVLSTVVPGWQLAADARSLADELRQARRAAADQGIEAVLRLDPGTSQYTRADGSTAKLAEGVAMADIAVAPGERRRDSFGVRFFPDGSSSGGRLALVNGSRRAVIEIDWLTGRVATRS